MKKNDIVNKWTRCPFCEAETRHEFIFDHEGFDQQHQKVTVVAYKSCLHCDWVQNVLTVLNKEDFEQLKPVI